MLTARAGRGTNTWPFGLPAAGAVRGAAAWVACVAVGPGFGDGDLAVFVVVALDAVSAALCGVVEVAQALNARPTARAAIPTATSRTGRMGPDRIGVPQSSPSSSLDSSATVSRFCRQRPLLWHEHRMAVEPGDATVFAGLFRCECQPGDGERIAPMLCGANSDPPIRA